MVHSRVDTAIIGGGPAGLAAAVSAMEESSSVLLIEREARLGGKLNQIVDNIFKLEGVEDLVTGPEIEFIQTSKLHNAGTPILLQTHVIGITPVSNAFQLTLSNRHGIMMVEANKVVLATGAFELSPRQFNLHGNRVAGIFTAGSVQHFINVLGMMPVKKCVILGSNNIAINLARRITLEGAEVLGLFEPLNEPQGSLKAISECLDNFGIPLYTNHTITRAIGAQRVRAVEVYQNTNNGDLISGSERAIKCDSLIVATQLVNDIDILNELNIKKTTSKTSPLCDSDGMTSLDGLFVCGNAAFISSDPNYAMETGTAVGYVAGRFYSSERFLTKINVGKDFKSHYPQYINVTGESRFNLYFRVSSDVQNKRVRFIIDGREVFSEEFIRIRPQDTIKISLEMPRDLTSESNAELRLE